MHNTSISFKAFLVAAALVSPFAVKAGDPRGDLKRINSNIGQTLDSMETDFNNQDDNNGPTALKAAYKRKFAGQLDQLKRLLDQANRGSTGSMGGARGRRGASASDLTIVPLITNAVANLQRLGELDALDQDTRDAAKEYLEAIDAGRDQRLNNQINAAVAVL